MKSILAGAFVALAAILPSISHADDGAARASTASKQARLDAWFEHERARTEGNVSPFMEEPGSNAGIAQSPSDAKVVARADAKVEAKSNRE